MNDNHSQDRQLAAEPVQVWVYQDNVEALVKICEEDGFQPGEVLRHAFDEWLSRLPPSPNCSASLCLFVIRLRRQFHPAKIS
jgi:hypothetical protein